jgi:hypothetical protein
MRKFKARSGGVGAASPGARERVSRSRTLLRLTRNQVATCRLEPSRFSLVCAPPGDGNHVRRVAETAPCRWASPMPRSWCMPAPTAVRAPRGARPTAVSLPDRGARGHVAVSRPGCAHLVRVTLPGVHASHGQEQSRHAWWERHGPPDQRRGRMREPHSASKGGTYELDHGLMHGGTSMRGRIWIGLGMACFVTCLLGSWCLPAPAEAAKKHILHFASKEPETLDPHTSVLGQGLVISTKSEQVLGRRVSTQREE